MRRQARTAAILLAFFAAGRTFGEPPCSELRSAPPVAAWSPDQATTGSAACFLRRLAPAGGWNPDGGGLLRWWPPHCFSRCGAPDDYCRKPLPPVCWPPYPPYYTWAPPEICYPHGNCRPIRETGCAPQPLDRPGPVALAPEIPPRLFPAPGTNGE